MPEIDDYTRRFHTRGGNSTIFQITRQEIGPPNYYLYVNDESNWYMMKQSVSGSVTTYEYANDGTKTPAQAWTNRASLTYQEYDEVFG